MDRNLHYIDHSVVESYADPEPSPAPAIAPVPVPVPTPAAKKNTRKVILYLLLVAAIIGLIYGLICLFKEMKGKKKYAASTRYYYF